MKLAREIIGLMSDYYSKNNLKLKMNSPVNQEYIEILKPYIITRFLQPLGYLSGTSDFDTELRLVPSDILTRVDLVVKGALFLHLNEIISWNEVKVLLNIGSIGETLYKIASDDDLGSYDIILPMLAVLFGKVSYEPRTTPITYNFKRLTYDVYYWDQPIYHYGYKASLSYGNIDDMLDNIDWFISENPIDFPITNLGIPRLEILGMLRINNKFCKDIIQENGLNPTIETEMERLGEYNVALNIIKLNDDSYGLGNVLFDFYKATKETTLYSDDKINYTEIDWLAITHYSTYIDHLYNYGSTEGYIDTNYTDIEKIGNIIRNIQNFLIH
jgi:hypothetical protein